MRTSDLLPEVLMSELHGPQSRMEGFKRERAPKIEVNRKERSKELICTPEKDLLIAVATDQDLDLSVPVFDINDAESIADFLIKTYLYI